MSGRKYINLFENGMLYYFPDLFSDVKTYKTQKYKGGSEEDYLFITGLAFANPEDALMEENFLRTLTRMRRFADKRNKGRLDWENEDQPKYGIAYDYSIDRFWISENYTAGHLFEVYFVDERDCQICLEFFRNELETIMKGGK